MGGGGASHLPVWELFLLDSMTEAYSCYVEMKFYRYTITAHKRGLC